MKLAFLKSKKSRQASSGRRANRDKNPVGSSYSFRTNRTITGSHSANIRSASEKDALLQSPRATAHHLRQKRRSLTAIFMAAIVASILLAFVVFQMIAATSVSIYGQVGAIDDQTEDHYSGLIDDYLRRNPTQRQRWSLDTSKLVDYLQQRGATEVEAVYDVAPKSLGEALIVLKMREPLASWTINGEKKYVDDSGTIFATNFFEEPSVTIVDKSGIRSSEVRAVASGRFLSFVGQSVGHFQDFGLRPQAVIIPTDTTRQAQIQLDNGIRVKLSVDRPAGEQAQDAAQAVGYLEDKRLQAEYVDVRVSGKAFYRVKG